MITGEGYDKGPKKRWRREKEGKGHSHRHRQEGMLPSACYQFMEEGRGGGGKKWVKGERKKGKIREEKLQTGLIFLRKSERGAKCEVVEQGKGVLMGKRI